MPILSIEWVEKAGESLSGDLADRLARRCAEALEAAQGETWVRLRPLPSRMYAEDGGVPPGIAPVFVEVLYFQLPDFDERSAIAKRLAVAVGDVMERPSVNVHILFQPEARGRIAFGGEMRRE